MENERVDTKTCTRCKQQKLRSEFYFAARTKDKLHCYCKDCCREVQREARARNPEHYRVLYRKWRNANLEKARALSRATVARLRQSPEWRQKQMDWWKRNPELSKLYRHVRRTRLTASSGKYTVEEWEGLKEMYDYRCLSCGKQEPEIKLTVDHVVPVSCGGANTIDNIQPLCRTCNSRKNAATLDFRYLLEGLGDFSDPSLLGRIL